jgi:two-component system nitrogen regulation response regulator GlnG
MGAVPPSLAAAELFGAARGAYTGAAGKREGYFDRARGGTLFLDEIGEMPPEVQALLLRALESGEIQTLGAEAPHRVDVRVVAATDADLETAVAAGSFRAPLLHRLRGYEIRLPALRERRDDVGRLFFHFVEQELATIGERLPDPGPEDRPWLPAAVMARLAAADWPGNVRQLKNAARQLVIASRGQPRADLATAERLVAEAARGSAGPPAEAPAGTLEPDPAYRRPEVVSEAELLAVLSAHRWRLQPAAAELGVSRASLYSLIERFPGVRKPADLGRDEIERCRERCGGDIEAMVDELQVSRKGLRRRMTELGIP